MAVSRLCVILIIFQSIGIVRNDNRFNSDFDEQREMNILDKSL